MIRMLCNVAKTCAKTLSSIPRRLGINHNESLVTNAEGAPLIEFQTVGSRH